MKEIKLLTPGPLTTSYGVKKEMLIDRCTWDDEYKNLTQKIRKNLLKIENIDEEKYTNVLMQGSGTFGVEAVLSTINNEKKKFLVLNNGEYGKRISEILGKMDAKFIEYKEEYDKVHDIQKISEILDNNKDITHLIVVHCETTTGILNPIEDIAKIVKEKNIKLVIDAMSSFGGIPINLKILDPDFLISSSNKCIQGVPGFSFIICKKDELENCKGNSKSLSLDLYEQWLTMNVDGKWRFTSPTHVVAAFDKALDELLKEGGISSRYIRYSKNNKRLIDGLREANIAPIIDKDCQSPIITTFGYPDNEFDFNDFYNFMKNNGYIIYPGKLTNIDTFRIGNIGEIYIEDIEEIILLVKEYMNSRTGGD